MRRIFIILALPALLLACSDSGAGGAAGWQTVRETAGDTAVVRTVGAPENAGLQQLATEVSIGTVDGPPETSFGSLGEIRLTTDGGIVAFDNQARALRQYSASGAFIRTIGRRGQGPGEYTSPNGLAVRRDGSVVLWDAGTARINVYSSEGENLDSWPVPGGGGMYTSNALFVDTLDNVYIRSSVVAAVSRDRERGVFIDRSGLVRYSPDGTKIDSVLPPPLEIEPEVLVARRGGSTGVRNVPYAASSTWTLSPHGHFVSAITHTYAITLRRGDGAVLRIERDLPAVRVDPAEKADLIEQNTASMQGIDPDWRWSGPSVPDVKPFIRALMTDDDGRIWVSVYRPGVRIPDDEVSERTIPSVVQGEPDRKMKGPKWRDPYTYDVYNPDGTFLGRVEVPDRTTLRVARGDMAWGIVRDDMDVQQLVRFRIVPGLGKQASTAER